MPETTASSMRRWAVLLGVCAAVLAPVSEIVTGSPLPYLLVLTLLAGLTWAVLRLSRSEMGLSIGGPPAILLPSFTPWLQSACLQAWSGRAVAQARNRSLPARPQRDWVSCSPRPGWARCLQRKASSEEPSGGVTARSRWKPISVLVWTSIAFMAWHIAVPLIEEDFRLVTHQIPIYYANVLLLGLAWGLLRLISGSILVACTAHASWNALVYVFFGYGMKSGALGVSRLSLFGPERGVLGLAVNAAVVLLLLMWWRKRESRPGD